MANEICTVAYVKQFPWATDISDGLLGLLIKAASDAIERECDRHFAARDYAGWHDGSGMRYLILPEWPVNSVYRVTIGTLDALTVVCDDAGATEAYANCDGTRFNLTILDGPNAGTVQITLATNTPLTALAATITATAGSWTGSALGSYGTYRSASLRPCGRRECYGSYAYFQIPDEGEADYIIDYQYGQVILPSGGEFRAGYRNVYVEYNAGHIVIPEALQEICAELVSSMYFAGASDKDLKSESLGDYSWTAFDRRVVDLGSKEMQQRLAPFKDNIV